METRDLRRLGEQGVEFPPKGRRSRLRDAGGEDDGTAFRHVDLEMAGHEEVFPAVVAATVLVRISDALVPAWSALELCLGSVELKIQVGEAVIHAERHATGNLPAFGTGGGILMGQGVDVPERKEWSKEQPDLRRSVGKVVTDQHLVRIRDQKDGLDDHHSPNLVGYLRHGVGLEIYDVLVAAGFVDVPETMDAEVELLAAQDQALVERREQQVLLTAERVHGHGQESMVAPGVAGHDGRVAVGPCLVGADNLPFQ